MRANTIQLLSVWLFVYSIVHDHYNSASLALIAMAIALFVEKFEDYIKVIKK